MPSIEEVTTIIMAGGEGTRLFPLTLNHCKPAVPFGGKYRLIDVAISNAIHADMKNIFVLGQYLTSELDFHLRYSYRCFSSASIQLLTPEMTSQGEKFWFEGTADAIRKCLPTFQKCPSEYFLILSGDQLYNINFIHMLEFAQETQAELIIASIPVNEEQAHRLGILTIDNNCVITNFIEKPSDESQLTSFKIPPHYRKSWQGEKNLELKYLASMGIYLFKREALFRLLQENKEPDFGKHLIPKKMLEGTSYAFLYDGYWEDIGTIASFYEANLALIDRTCGLDIYNDTKPIFTKPNFLSGPKITHTQIDHSILCEGSIIEAKEISHSIIGIRSRIQAGSILKKTITLGSYGDFPELSDKRGPEFSFHIGKNCFIETAILDEDIYIGDGVILKNEENLSTYDGEGIFIREGIIIVTAGTFIPDNFIL